MFEDTEWSRADLILAILVASCFIIAIGAILISQMHPFEQPQQYWDSAPDGYYDVIPFKVETGHVSFPLSETSGSQLHGRWQYMKGLEFTLNEWNRVYVKDNIITECIYIGHMHP